MQQLIAELRRDGLNDDEIVWYAVNMHDAVESEVRQALNPGLDQPKDQTKPAREPVTRDNSTTAQPVQADGHASRGGVWVVVNTLLIAAIISAWTSMFSLAKLFSYSSREPLIEFLVVISVALLFLWSVLRQLVIAFPGHRLACASRPVLFILFVLGLEQVVGSLIGGAWDLYIPGLIATGFVSLIFFEIAVIIRRWLTLSLVLPLAVLHFLFLDFSLQFYYAIYSAAQYGVGIFDEPFRFYFLSDPPGYEMAGWLLNSFLIGFIAWALLNRCGRSDPGRSLAQWKETLASLPRRLLRGEVGLARSFWYFGVLGGTPIRVVMDAAATASEISIAVVAAFIGALYWAMVTLAVWRSGDGYQGSKIWWVGAVTLSALSVASMVSVVVLAGMNS